MDKRNQQELLAQLEKYYKSINEYCNSLNENLKRFEKFNLDFNQNLKENSDEKEKINKPSKN